MLLGHTCVCAVEIEPYCRKVLLQRQRDGILPKFPIWNDVRTFDGKPWRGKVDIICGGFPCQDISCAGKGAGIEGERSELWSEFARIISEVRPRYAFVENSPMLAIRGLGRVLGDLSEIGYDARWCVMGADDVGAPHIRKRMWILAHARYGCGGGIVSDKELEELANGNWKRPSGSLKQLRLQDQVRHPRLWPTPTVCGNNNRKGLSKTSGDGLATAVLRYPTPNCSGMDGGSNSRKANKRRGIHQMLYPTPTCHDTKANISLRQNHQNGLGEVVHGGLETPPTKTARLNPNWVEWLMGWPIGWTDLKPLATDKFRLWRQQHLNY